MDVPSVAVRRNDREVFEPSLPCDRVVWGRAELRCPGLAPFDRFGRKAAGALLDQSDALVESVQDVFVGHAHSVCEESDNSWLVRRVPRS